MKPTTVDVWASIFYYFITLSFISAFLHPFLRMNLNWVLNKQQISTVVSSLEKVCQSKNFWLSNWCREKQCLNGAGLQAEQEAFVFPSSIKKTPSKKYFSQARISLCVDRHKAAFTAHAWINPLIQVAVCFHWSLVAENTLPVASRTYRGHVCMRQCNTIFLRHKETSLYGKQPCCVFL